MAQIYRNFFLRQQKTMHRIPYYGRGHRLRDKAVRMAGPSYLSNVMIPGHNHDAGGPEPGIGLYGEADRPAIRGIHGQIQKYDLRPGTGELRDAADPVIAKVDDIS